MRKQLVYLDVSLTHSLMPIMPCASQLLDCTPSDDLDLCTGEIVCHCSLVKQDD